METTRWRGIIPALVTPLTAAGDIDAPALRRVIQFALDGGVDGLSVLGSTGEGALLPMAAQRRALEVAVEAKGEKPVLAGVIASVPADARDFARMALESGADGVLVTPPFYYLLEQQAVISFFTYLDHELHGPVFIYHIPQFTKVTLEPDTVARLADLPHIAGIKDSSRDVDFHRRLLEATRDRDFAVFTGAGALLSVNTAGGGAGTIAGCANLVPQDLVRLRRTLGEGNTAEAERLQQRVAALEDAVRQFPFPANWKACLEIAGLLLAHPAFPLHRLSAVQMTGLREALHDLGVVPQRV
jgi:4-hydroxy-tetrahydrodipicolinate synthase